MQKLKSYAKVSRGKRPLIAVFDLETRGLGGEPLAASYQMSHMNSPEYLTGKNFLQELFWTMCENHQYIWFAHNAQYDLRYLIDRLEERMTDLRIYLRTDQDVFMVTLNMPEHGDGAQLVIRDSLALFPSSLRDFGKSFAPELPKQEIDITNFNPKDPTHIEYCKRDSQLLLTCLTRFFDLVSDHFDINAAATTASTAMRGWQRTLPKGQRYYNPQTYEPFIRSAYYGGIVFLTDTNIHENTKSFDKNSSYPYQMLTHNFPLGNPVNTRIYRDTVPGIYRVTLKTPPDLIVPIIPARDRKGIIWPSGTFETTVTSVELAFALSHGYRLLTVHEGLFWEDTCNPFRHFIAKCRELRFAHKGTALETVAKLMQNSLYGKFATKRKRKKIYASYTEEETFGGQMWGEYLIREEIDDDMMCLPQWAVFITAHARIDLLSTVYQIGPENVLYGDTDSITIKQNAVMPENLIGKEYGQWKLEKAWQCFRARAPKVYAGRLEDGMLKGAMKGIPRSQWQSSGALNAVLNGTNTTVEYETLDSFVLFLKGKRREAFSAHRQISEIENSRSWQRLPDGRVRPRDFGEISVAREHLCSSFDEANGHHSFDDVDWSKVA